MNKLNELEARLAGVTKELDSLVGVRDAESREFTADEKATFDRKYQEAHDLKASIETERKAEEIRKQRVLDKKANETPEETVAKKFSFQRAIGGVLRGKLDGVEAELSEEANNERRGIGISDGVQGIGLPSFMVKMRGQNVYGPGQVRDLTSGGSGTGQELVADLDLGHIYGLNIRPQVAALGATVLTGLTGDVYFTKSGTVSATWEGEVDAGAEVTPATSRVSMNPHRLGCYAQISKTLLTQTGNMAEEITRREIETAIAVGLDSAAIEGNGTFSGLTAYSGVNDVAMGTNGLAPTRAKLLEMEKLIADDNADLGAMAYLTTPGIRYFLKTLATDAGSGLFVWDNQNTIVGIPAYISNNVPSDLTKGTSSGVCHAIFLGVWNQLLIGQWGGLDIVVDPYSSSKNNMIDIVVNGHFDVEFRHAQSFARILDALTA